ncbi:MULTISPECIES: BrnT family toxin [Methylobacterium]|uniref:BrnT family toxin n=1 Tax=Methylobacterium TaxID=407 RepID=UPI0028AD6708|nr:BrnT family toxin [Methylobacterium sp. DB0501]
MPVVNVEWDDGNRVKCQKHGVSIAEIEDVFRGRLQIAPDLKHSVTEQRLIAIGRTSAGRSVFIAFTLRRYGSGSGRSALGTCIAKRLHPMVIKVPEFSTDDEAEIFLEQDLSDLDFSQFRPV